MRKCFALALLVVFSWLGGIGQDARAGVTFDVLFQDGTGHALTITEGDPGPGCSFGGFYGGSVSTGRCMDVVMRTTDEWVGFSTRVTYSSNSGLALASMYEWKGVGVSFDTSGNATEYCYPASPGFADGGLVDHGGNLQAFDCIIAPPNAPPQVPAGTYKLGTIIWDTSSATPGHETIAAYIDDRTDGFIATINGNYVLYENAQITQNSALLTISPEPGTAALLGLGLVGLVLAARRRRD